MSSTLTLRPYQQEAVDAIYEYFEEHGGNPLIVIPTAGGKALIMATFIREAMRDYPDQRILVVTHVRELIAQNYAELKGIWPEAPAGIYSAGLKRRELQAQILFCGIQSIHAKAYDLQKVDLILVDEAHLIPRSSDTLYGRFINDLRSINPYLKVIGFTATPFRLDSGRLTEGKSAVFDDIAYEAGIVRLIEDGYLARPISVSSDVQIDTSSVGTRNGDFIAGQLEAVALDPDTVRRVADTITAEIVGGERRGCIVFAVGREHGRALTEALRERAVNVDEVYGDTPMDERDRIINQFKAQKLQAVVSVGVLTTGFNARHVDLIAVVRPTQSTGLWIQMVGRGTRLFPGKSDCRVLDFGGNIARHGPIDQPNVKPPPGEGDAPSKDCPACGAKNYAAARVCRECGEEFPPTERRPKVSTVASGLAILSGDKPIPDEWARVDSVRYRRHHKPGKPPSMHVMYDCGFAVHAEWVCFEHQGYARQKAVQWWRQRAPGIAVPDTVDDALKDASKLMRPSEIKVRVEGKFTRVVGMKLP